MNTENLVDAWITLQKMENGSSEHSRLFWAYEALAKMCQTAPEECLSTIVSILQRDRSMESQANLAAGPLEDLLVSHGSLLIDRIEDLANSNADFRHLLGGVWKNDIADGVWERVQRVRGSAW